MDSKFATAKNVGRNGHSFHGLRDPSFESHCQVEVAQFQIKQNQCGWLPLELTQAGSKNASLLADGGLRTNYTRDLDLALALQLHFFPEMGFTRIGLMS